MLRENFPFYISGSVATAASQSEKREIGESSMLFVEVLIIKMVFL